MSRTVDISGIVYPNTLQKTPHNSPVSSEQVLIFSLLYRVISDRDILGVYSIYHIIPAEKVLWFHLLLIFPYHLIKSEKCIHKQHYINT